MGSATYEIPNELVIMGEMGICAFKLLEKSSRCLKARRTVDKPGDLLTWWTDKMFLCSIGSGAFLCNPKRRSWVLVMAANFLRHCHHLREEILCCFLYNTLVPLCFAANLFLIAASSFRTCAQRSEEMSDVTHS